MAAPRQLLLSLLVLLSCAALAAAVSTSLVINEVDYDQPSLDTAEFIEIKNVGTASVALSGWTLQLVNGGVSPPAVYKTISLAPVTLAPGGYFVVCSTQGGTVANCNQVRGPNAGVVNMGILVCC